MHPDAITSPQWLQQCSSWVEAAAALNARQQSFVLVTVLSVTGSAPRAAGTKMLICTEGIVGTIGGGHLEYLAIARAHAMITGSPSETAKVVDEPVVEQTAEPIVEEHTAEPTIEEYPLGARLGQCCGGRVTLLYESFLTQLTPVFVFGAGHVGRALTPILAELPLAITWVDSRHNEFPDAIPSKVKKHVSALPDEDVIDIPAGACVIVMTHNHTLDFDIVRKALARDDLAYVGVIGSQTKAKRFRNRLEHRGFSAEKIASLRCPIGLSAVPGKRPMEVAVSIAGEVIAFYNKQPLSPQAIHHNQEFSNQKAHHNTVSCDEKECITPPIQNNSEGVYVEPN